MTDRDVQMLIDLARAVRAGCIASGLTRELDQVCDVVGHLELWAESMRDNGSGRQSDLRAEVLAQAVSHLVAVSARGVA